ncbi:MAG: hypothetical protein HY040_19085 [Planctomycetes bacterium]|nr:hypothetical protein [Planctomycetota bacterium]
METGLPLDPASDSVDDGSSREPSGNSLTPVRLESSERDALRVQAAAVAAQQAALTEEESRLSERRQALQEQEEQLAAHLENKRQNVLLLRDRVRQDRNALDEKRVRLIELGRRLRVRWQRLQSAVRAKLSQREDELCQEERGLNEWAQRLDEHEAALVDKRLRFNGMYELGRRQLKDAWQRLRQEQARWKHRRGQERAALKVRDLDLEAGERQLALAQRLFLREKQGWDEGKARLTTELIEIDRRVWNQRSLLVQNQQELLRLDGEIQLRRSVLERLTPVDTQAATEFLKDEHLEVPSGSHPSADAAAEAAADVQVHADAHATVPPPVRVALPALEQLAGDLADQRWQLMQSWHRLALLNQRWQEERTQAEFELEEWTGQIQESGRRLAVREEAVHRAEAELRREEEALILLRQHVMAWNVRLKTREATCEGERCLALENVRRREADVERHLRSLGELREGWVKRRRLETQKLRGDRQEIDDLRRENAELRRRLLQEAMAVGDEKRAAAEKALALEQYRQELLNKSPNPPAAERRLERLRRRWITQNAEAIRLLARSREILNAELDDLGARRVELHSRIEQVTTAEAELSEKQSAWEYQVERSNVSQDRLQLALEHAEERRNDAEQQVRVVREEIERIARSLLEEPETPTADMDQAA